MDIGFVWDRGKYHSVMEKHRVYFYAVVAAFEDPHGYEVPDPANHLERWAWIGRTPLGRILIVIYSEEELPLYRIITSYEAEGRWLDEYYQRKNL